MSTLVSTLVGCLTKRIKDDGRGYARKYVFNYQHETESGRTSSIRNYWIKRW